MVYDFFIYRFQIWIIGPPDGLKSIHLVISFPATNLITFSTSSNKRNGNYNTKAGSFGFLNLAIGGRIPH